MSLTISARYEEALRGMVWRGRVYLDDVQIYASMHDSYRKALRAATKARDDFLRGGYDELVRQAMLLDITMQRQLYGEPAYSPRGAWDPDEATNILPQSRDGDGGREGELSWS